MSDKITIKDIQYAVINTGNQINQSTEIAGALVDFALRGALMINPPSPTPADDQHITILIEEALFSCRVTGQ